MAGIKRSMKRMARKVLGRGKAYNALRAFAVQVLRRGQEPWMDSFGNTFRVLQLRSHAEKDLGKEELKQLKEVLESRNLFRGPKAEQFRREFAQLYGVRHAISSTSGTAAVHVAMAMIDPDPGDEIIVPPITDMGTIIPVLYQNAIPVFADIDPYRWTLDPESVARQITPRTRAIIAVHIFGAPAEMNALREIARRHNLVLIEDCAQAHLAEYDGQRVGTLGAIGCFSFQQTKQMTTGEGGMTITNDDAYAERGRLFVDKGWDREAPGDARQYRMLGINYRMTELQAAVGLAQLRKIERIAQRRHRNGSLLAELLRKTPGLTVQHVGDNDRHTYYTFGFTVNFDAPFTAEALVRVLTERGIPASKNYIGKPIFLCSEPFARKQFYGRSHFPFDYPGARSDVPYEPGTCPIAEDVLRRLVGIPITEHYSEKDIAYVATAIQRAVDRLSRHASIPGWTPPAEDEISTASQSQSPTRRSPAASRKPQSAICRAAIIGCGAIARDHAMGYQALSGITLVALADINPDALKTVGSEFNVSRAYTDFREMLAQEKPDIVSICTWPGLHAEMTVAAAEMGVRAIFCEKPMAVNLGEADRMIQACERHDVKLAIAHQFRFNPHLTRAKELIAEGAIGMPELVWGHWDSSLLNRGTHVIDAMRYLLGDPPAEWVLGQAVREKESVNRGHRVEEVAQGLIHFTGGTRGLLESGELAPKRFELHVYGSEGQIRVGLDALVLQGHGRQKTIRLPRVAEHQEALAALLAWLEERAETHRGDATQARADLEILMAIFESARARTVVRLPLTLAESPLDRMAEEQEGR